MLKLPISTQLGQIFLSLVANVIEFKSPFLKLVFVEEQKLFLYVYLSWLEHRLDIWVRFTVGQQNGQSYWVV